MSWINELTSYYSRIDKSGNLILSVTQSRVTALYREYQYNDDDVLIQAANAYMRENDYFPTILGFKEYLRMAAYSKPRRYTREAPLAPFGSHGTNGKGIELLDDVDKSDIDKLTDEQRYSIEVKRGSMRPLSEIEAEIAAARIQLKEMTP